MQGACVAQAVLYRSALDAFGGQGFPKHPSIEHIYIYVFVVVNASESRRREDDRMRPCGT